MSDEPKKPKSHLIRLIVLMFWGAMIGVFFGPSIGHRLEFWFYAAPYAQALAGAIGGLLIELWCRLDARKAR